MNRYFWILGAFIALAFLIAAKNAIDARRKRLARVLPVSSPLPEGAH